MLASGTKMGDIMTELPLDSFRSSTLGWLRGTLAGWATILLIIGGIVLTLLLPAGEGGVGSIGSGRRERRSLPRQARRLFR